MQNKTRIFHIKDIDCEVVIERFKNIKDAFSYIDEYTENLQYDWFDGSDNAFNILYKDGKSECINEEYDGHHIRKNNIISIVYDNPCTSMVYGPFEINEYGVVTPALEEKIAEDNIEEVGNE